MAPSAVSSTAGTSAVQNAQRLAFTGILLRHSGHSRVLTGGGEVGLYRSVSVLTGSTTRK